MTDDERDAERKRLTEKLTASQSAGPGYAARVKAIKAALDALDAR